MSRDNAAEDAYRIQAPLSRACCQSAIEPLLSEPLLGCGLLGFHDHVP